MCVCARHEFIWEWCDWSTTKHAFNHVCVSARAKQINRQHPHHTYQLHEIKLRLPHSILHFCWIYTVKSKRDGVFTASAFVSRFNIHAAWKNWASDSCTCFDVLLLLLFFVVSSLNTFSSIFLIKLSCRRIYLYQRSKVWLKLKNLRWCKHAFYWQ